MAEQKMTSAQHTLIGDIGGTNARFAIAAPGETTYTHELSLKCADFQSPFDAIAHYLAKIDEKQRPQGVCLAVAAPIVGNRAHFVNSSWSIDKEELVSRFPEGRVQLINDLEAVALSIPLLASRNLITIGENKLDLRGDYKVCVAAPGTGLGAAGLFRQNGRFIAIPGEAGHLGFAPQDTEQVNLLAALSERFGRVSAERLLSGPGIENIYAALREDSRQSDSKLSAQEIFEAALSGKNQSASRAIDLFFSVLGQFCGDFALAINAYDGVFIAGGIVKRFPELLTRSRFRQKFENKGRYQSILEKVPTHLITHDQPGLLGASLCARNLELEN